MGIKLRQITKSKLNLALAYIILVGAMPLQLFVPSASAAPSTPVASPVAGTYNSAQSVSLTSAGSTWIQYSTSATPGCFSGTTYTGAISVASSQTLYVRGCTLLFGSSTASFAYVIDTTAPTITSVSSDKANGTYAVGEVIDIDVTFSEAVTSTGNVLVTLDTGGNCVFTVTSSTSGTCNYTVADSEDSSDLDVSSISVSGIIKDAALNPMTNFVPTTNLATNKAIVIDTTKPTVDAGPDRTEGTEFTQVGSSSDSGSGVASRAWSMFSGPGTITFGDDTSDITTVSADVDGTYVLKLVATDNAGNHRNDKFTLVWDTTKPTVDAGPDRTEGTEFTQVGSSSDSGSGVASRAWSMFSGPGTITFGDDTSDITTVSADVDGTYVLKLVATDNAGNHRNDKFTLVWDTSANDNDGDGHTNGIEDGAPNSGDANNDETLDKNQANVTSFFNSVAGSYAVLESSPCSLNQAVSVAPESSLFADPSFNYPFGIMNFTLTCEGDNEGPVTATITQYFYGTFDASTVTARKYNPTTHTYTTIPGAVITNVTIGGLPALKIVYEVTDGSLLDQDGLVNGTIVDPAGPAIRASVPAVLSAVTTTPAVKTAVTVPNTGVQKQSNSTPIALITFALGLILVSNRYGKSQTNKKR